MATIRAIDVNRDRRGRLVSDADQIEAPRSSGFGWGVLLGIVLIALAITTYAYNDGSFAMASQQVAAITSTN